MRRSLLLLLTLLALAGVIAINEYYPLIVSGVKPRKYAAIAVKLSTALLVIRSLKIIVTGVYRRRRNLPEYKHDNFLLAVDQITAVLVAGALLTSLLAFFNVRFRDFFTSISIVAAALALLTKDYIANFISGIIITLSNQLSIDDHVRIHEHEGKITDISLANISLLNDDDDIIYIPNNIAFNSEILNYSKGDIRRTSIEFSVDLKHMSSIAVMEKRLFALLEPHLAHILPDSPRLKVYDISHEDVKMKLQYTLQKPDRMVERAIRRDVRRNLLDVITSMNQA